MEIRTKYKMLSVDEEKEVQRFLKRLFFQKGYRLYTAQGGKEGIAQTINSCPDLILLDLVLPDMDGIEAAGLIRKISEYCKEQLVIIALSANAVNGMEKQFIEADMNDFLAKPIESEKLAEILEKWLPNEKIRYV